MYFADAKLEQKNIKLVKFYAIKVKENIKKENRVRSAGYSRNDALISAQHTGFPDPFPHFIKQCHNRSRRIEQGVFPCPAIAFLPGPPVPLQGRCGKCFTQVKRLVTRFTRPV